VVPRGAARRRGGMRNSSFLLGAELNSLDTGRRRRRFCPFRDHPPPFSRPVQVPLTLFAKFFSPFDQSTCTLSVHCQYRFLREIHLALGSNCRIKQFYSGQLPRTDNNDDDEGTESPPPPPPPSRRGGGAGRGLRSLCRFVGEHAFPCSFARALGQRMARCAFRHDC